ncbi:hypothetical protein MMC07_000535 [Pseudocyphellaria aurata]|nr:hypothetical protein [Pseudocyphellaria aurata]
MADTYNSTSSAPSAAKPADMADTSRLHSHSSLEDYAVGRIRTRVPSGRKPHPGSRALTTASDLLAAEPGRVDTHQAAQPQNLSVSRNVGPLSSVSRSAGDLSTLGTQRIEIPRASPNAGSRQILSYSDSGREVMDYRRRAAVELTRDQILPALSASLGSSESSASGGPPRVISTGSINRNRDVSGSSSSSQDLPALAFQKYNDYARQLGLSTLEEGRTDETPPVPRSRGSQFLRKSGSRARMTLSNITKKALKRPASKTNLPIPETITSEEEKRALYGKTIEELGKAGLSRIILPDDFTVGEPIIPTFLRNLMIYIDRSDDKGGVFRLSSSKDNVNNLYDYFVSLFPKADDEEKYDQGAASTILPEFLEYDIHDVASVFKRIVKGLTCGVLGSMSLFRALDSINKKFMAANSSPASPQAKLIALAISSIVSEHRKYFIIAYFGLASMIGHKTLEARVRGVRGDLMDFHALGMTLAPCLVGCSLDEIVLDVQRESSAQARDVHNASEPANSMGQRFKIAWDVTEMIISRWTDIIKHLKIIDPQEAIRQRNIQLAKEREQSRRSSGRLPEVQEDVELIDDSRTAIERPLQHVHSVDQLLVDPRHRSSFSHSAANSSTGGNVRHHSGSGGFPQERSERGSGDNRNISAQRKQSHVQHKNISRSTSSSNIAFSRDQLDGQREVEFIQDHRFSASTNVSRLLKENNRPNACNVQTQSSTQGAVLDRVPNETGAAGKLVRHSDPTGHRPSSVTNIHSQQLVQSYHQTQAGSGHNENRGLDWSREGTADGDTSTAPTLGNLSQSRSLSGPDTGPLHISDDSRNSRSNRRWGTTRFDTNLTPSAGASTQERDHYSLVDGKMVLTNLISRPTSEPSSAVPSNVAQDHFVGSVNPSPHHITDLTATSTNPTNPGGLAIETNEANMTRRTSVKCLAQRIEAAHRQGSESRARDVAAPAVASSSSLAPSSLAPSSLLPSSSLLSARVPSGIPCPAASTPSIPVDAEVLTSQTRALLASPEAGPSTSAPTEDENATQSGLRAQLAYATRAADAWRARAACLQKALEGPDQASAEAHEEGESGKGE